MRGRVRGWALGLALGGALGAAAGSAAAAQETAAGAAADTPFHATTLRLSAEGETRLAPDMATIDLGVTTEAATAQAAMQADAARMSQVLAALRRGGIAAKDVRTYQVGLEPRYVYEKDQPPRLSGYRAANRVSVTVRDLSRLGAAVDAAVAAGANEAGSISFGLADPAAARDAAREAAVKALAAKAELYAHAAGYRVLRLVQLGEGAREPSPIPPLPLPQVAFTARARQVETPVSPGEVRVRVEVDGVYELAR